MIFEGFSDSKQVMTVNTSANALPADILKTRSERAEAGSERLSVYAAALVGAFETGADGAAVYNNMLYDLRQSLIASSKLLIYIENELRLPTRDELSVFDGTSGGDGQAPSGQLSAGQLSAGQTSASQTSDGQTSGEDSEAAGTEEPAEAYEPMDVTPDPPADKPVEERLAELIDIEGDELRTKIAREEFAAFYKLLPEDKYNRALKILCWLKRCVSSEAYRIAAHEIPALMRYGGGLSEDEAYFLCFCSRIGFDVIFITQDKRCLDTLKGANLGGRIQIFEMPVSSPVMPYPVKRLKTKLATVAYNAERELDTFLYGDTTIFRDFQFSDIHAVTLKTTYEEIDILWHQPAKFRTGFNVQGETAFVPNIFAKISGVKDGNLDAYWNNLKFKLSPYSRMVSKAPDYKKTGYSSLAAYSRFYNGETILIEKLKASPYNKYGFLSEDLQDLIFRKMQEAADSGFLKLSPSELIPTIIHVGLNIDKEILKMLQKFDFTKDVPKFIITDVIEETFSKAECVQLVLFNLFGFDIIVYTPTGYRNLETFINESAYEVYTMNEFKYNVRVPKFKIPDDVPDFSGGGLINKLFKKGR